MKVLSPDTHAAVDAAKGEAVELCAAVLHDTLLAAHRADAKITYEEIAGRTGAKPAHVGEWCNPLSGRTVALYRVAMMGARVAPAVLRALADAIEADLKTSWQLFQAGAQVPIALWGLGPIGYNDLRQLPTDNPFPPAPVFPLPPGTAQ